MTPLERFNAWLKGDKVRYPNQSGVAPGKSYVLVRTILLQLGHDQAEIDRAIRQISHWLIANEGSQKANKQLWGKFLLNWLKPNDWNNGGRLAPSNFD